MPSQPAGERETKAAPKIVDRMAIAVLPFENLSADENNAYFVSGMRDEILTSLAQMQDLNGRSRTSSQKYQSHPVHLRACLCS